MALGTMRGLEPGAGLGLVMSVAGEGAIDRGEPGPAPEAARPSLFSMERTFPVEAGRFASTRTGESDERKAG